MANVHRNNGLTPFQEAHHQLFNPPEGTLTRWAFEKINVYHNEDKITINCHLARLLKRLVAVAIPVFAFLDALQLGGKMVWRLCALKRKDALYDLLNCGKSLLLFLASIPLTPVALISPIMLYRTPERWESIRVTNIATTNEEMAPNTRGPEDHHALPAQPIQADNNQMNEYLVLIKELKLWVSDLSVEGKKKKAARRIRVAFENNESVLDLQLLRLNKLPPCIGKLTWLKKLNLSKNKLVSLPSEIGQLTQIEWLNLSKNKLVSLPSEIGQLTQIEWLYLRFNSNLNDVPLSLGQIPGLTWLIINGTGISEEMRDAILRQCRALRDAQAAKILPTRLQSWKVKSNCVVDLSGVEKLDEDNKKLINEWLVRLERTKDFKSNSQSALAKTVCQMLEDVVKNEAFRELFFAQIGSNLECCRDRAAMALNEIYTSWKITQLDDHASISERLQIMARGAKTLALRAAIAYRIDQHQKEINGIEREAVEIYLYYETELKDKLNLLSAIEKMAYEELGKRDWIDEQSLIEEVNKTYLDHLIKLPAFEKIIENDEAYKRACKEQVEPLDKEMEALFESKAQEANKLSKEYLDWHHQIGELNRKRKNVISKIKKEWAQERL